MRTQGILERFTKDVRIRTLNHEFLFRTTMILQVSPGIYLASLIAGSLLYVGLMLKQSCCQIILFF